jgi:hypothetical protein
MFDEAFLAVPAPAPEPGFSTMPAGSRRTGRHGCQRSGPARESGFRSSYKSVSFAIRILLPLVVTMLASPLIAADITRQAVLDGMNAVRAAHDLPPLHFEPRLDNSADDRMHDMEDLGYWSHQSPDGRSPFLWLTRHNYEFSFAGENLATGFETSELLVESWMESKGHRDNILSPFYTECGMAIIEGSTTERRMGKSIVVLFARPRM